MNKLFIGMDISKKDVKICIIAQSGEDATKRFAIDNNTVGAQTLIDTVVTCCEKHSVTKIFFGYESTSIYGTPLQYFLADNLKLKPYNPSVIRFNAKIIDNFKGSLGNLPKNDWVDAFTIAERLRFGRLPKSCPVDFRYTALQRLTRHRFHIVGNIVGEKNYFLTNLFLKFSGLCQDNVFSNTFGNVATEILNEFASLEEIAARPLNELVDFIVEKGKDHFEDPVTTAKALQDAVNKSFKPNKSVDNSLTFVIRSCLENIKSMEKQKKDVEKAIQNEVIHFKNEYTALTSVKGIGPVIAAGIISEAGGIQRFENDNSLAKFSGLYWSEYQSADFVAEDTYIRRTGNEYLRYYFVQAADKLRKFLPEFNEYYSRKFKESRTHHHKRALVLTARKAVRLIFALLREEKLYKSPARKGGK